MAAFLADQDGWCNHVGVANVCTSTVYFQRLVLSATDKDEFRNEHIMRIIIGTIIFFHIIQGTPRL